MLTEFSGDECDIYRLYRVLVVYWVSFVCVCVCPAGGCCGHHHHHHEMLDDESVFVPKSDLDLERQDMDDEERELEAFKRFCFNTVPPERKEKVGDVPGLVGNMAPIRV